MRTRSALKSSNGSNTSDSIKTQSSKGGRVTTTYNKITRKSPRSAKIALPSKDINKAKPTKIEPIKEESSSIEEVSPLTDANEYEEMRLKNIKEREELLKELKIGEVKENLHALIKVKENRKPPRKKVIKPMPPPRPKSLRLQKIKPEGNPLTIALPELTATEEPQIVIPPGPLLFSEAQILKDETLPDFSRAFLDLKCEEPTEEIKHLNFEKCKDVLSSLHCRGFIKLTKSRVTGLAIHPTQVRPIIAATDKFGMLGITALPSFETLSEEVLEEKVPIMAFQLHERSTYGLKFSVHHPENLYSCSSDGVFRCANFEAQVFDEILRSDYCLNYLDFVSPTTCALVTTAGEILIRDLREERNHKFTVTNRSIRCIDVHPTESNYLVTSESSGLAKVWDRRNLKSTNSSSVMEIVHKKAVNSAFFSPLTGNHILTTGLDDSIRISGFGLDKFKGVRIRQDTKTNRWLTKLAATWTHWSEEFFLVGSLEWPRRLNLYHSTSGQLLHTLADEPLTTICSLVDSHPKERLIIGGNSTGKVYIFH